MFKMSASKPSMILVLGSGGQRAPYMEGFIHTLGFKNWDHVFGISAGAILGAFIVQTEESEFKEELNTLMKQHVDIVKPHIIIGPILNLVSSFLWHESIFRPCLKSIVSTAWKHDRSHEKLVVGAYNVSKGEYTSFKDPNVDQVVASASIPVVFPSVKIDGNDYVDGAIAHIFPIEEIKKNYNAGDQVYVMLCYPTDHEKYTESMQTNTTKLLGRVYNTLDESTWQNMNRDLNDLADFFELDHAAVRKSQRIDLKDKGTLYMFIPDEVCCVDLACKNFQLIINMQTHGKKVAHAVLNKVKL